MLSSDLSNSHCYSGATSCSCGAILPLISSSATTAVTISNAEAPVTSSQLSKPSDLNLSEKQHSNQGVQFQLQVRDTASPVSRFHLSLTEHHLPSQQLLHYHDLLRVGHLQMEINKTMIPAPCFRDAATQTFQDVPCFMNPERTQELSLQPELLVLGQNHLFNPCFSYSSSTKMEPRSRLRGSVSIPRMVPLKFKKQSQLKADISIRKECLKQDRFSWRWGRLSTRDYLTQKAQAAHFDQQLRELNSQKAPPKQPDLSLYSKRAATIMKACHNAGVQQPNNPPSFKCPERAAFADGQTVAEVLEVLEKFNESNQCRGHIVQRTSISEGAYLSPDALEELHAALTKLKELRNALNQARGCWKQKHGSLANTILKNLKQFLSQMKHLRYQYITSLFQSRRPSGANQSLNVDLTPMFEKQGLNIKGLTRKELLMKVDRRPLSADTVQCLTTLSEFIEWVTQWNQLCSKVLDLYPPLGKMSPGKLNIAFQLIVGELESCSAVINPISRRRVQIALMTKVASILQCRTYHLLQCTNLSQAASENVFL